MGSEHLTPQGSGRTGPLGVLVTRPRLALYLAIGAIVIAAILLVVCVTAGNTLVLSILGYVLSSLVAFTFIALFRRGMDEERARTARRTSPGLARLATSVLVVGLVVAVGSAYMIATAFA